MRNRTELVTTTMPGSENEEEEEEVDSEEDWKPEKKKTAKTGVAVKTTPKSATKRKSTTAASATPKPRGRPKKVKKEESEDEDHEFVDEDDEEDDDDDDFDDEDEEDDEPKRKKNNKKGGRNSGGSAQDGASKPGRRPGAQTKSFPDKDGKFELYLFKNDLVKDFRNDTKMCMWRRDGSSLLQKYIRVKNEDDNQVDVFFTASSVYSCWEEKRKNDFFQINVQCIGEKRDGKVKVIDVPELARFAAEERQQDGSSATGSASSTLASSGVDQNRQDAGANTSATGEEFDEELDDEEDDEEDEEE